jgi:hypothetical protein
MTEKLSQVLITCKMVIGIPLEYFDVFFSGVGMMGSIFPFVIDILIFPDYFSPHPTPLKQGTQQTLPHL